VRAQQTYLDAIQAAQPLIDEALHYGTALLEEDEQIANTLVIAIEQRIDADYADTQHFRTILEEQQREILIGLQLIREFYQTEDPTALRTLGQKIARLHEILRGRPPLASDIPDIEAFLMQQLANIRTIGEQLEPDFQAWEEAHEELDLLYRIFLDNNRRAKLALTVWGRAHQKMASGVKNPAEWFSLGDLFNLGTKAVEKAL
jgi:hypothetical protein